jgi:hypothetical protein
MSGIAARASSLLLAYLAANSSPSQAQALRGRLVEASSDAPVGGALVSLEDSTGRKVAQAVSGSTGRFILRAPNPGSFTLLVLRIGYAPSPANVHLVAGQTLDHSLALTNVRIVLPEVKVEGQPLCGARVMADSLSAVLWDQARTALALTNEAVASRRYRYYTVLQDRMVDSTRTRTIDLPSREVSNLVTQWPLRSPPPDSLLANGFVMYLEDLIDGPSWYGPDAEYLLSDPFFADHCFQLVPPGSDQPAEWVGLAFEPALRSARADIHGVLWLDRANAELRRLDFAYSRLPSWAHGRDAFGQLSFAPVPGGGWIVQRWVLRVPIPQVDHGTRKARFLEYRESGGYVSRVLTADGREVVRYPQ